MGNRHSILMATATFVAAITAGGAAPPAAGVRAPGLLIIPNAANPMSDDRADTNVDLPIVNHGFSNDQDVQGSISPLVDALRAESFAQRVNAQETLLRLPPARLKDIVAAMGREKDAEAVERLTQVAAHLYLKPRTTLQTKASLLGLWHAEPSLSMLGMKFKMDLLKLQPTDPEPVMTVMVTEMQPGFPIMQTLRNGDRIVALGGAGFPVDLPLEDSTGGMVAMTILRDGKLLKVHVQVTGLPVDGPTSPADLVSQRDAALQAFLQTLKTPETKQASFYFLAPAYNSPTRAQLITSQIAARYSGRRF
jgi:hypothetical protein